MTKRQSRIKNGVYSLILIASFFIGVVVPYYAVPPMVLLAIAAPWVVVTYYWYTKQLSRDRFGRVFQLAGMMGIMPLAMNREIRRIYIIDSTSLYILAVVLGLAVIIVIFKISAKKNTEMKFGTLTGKMVTVLSFLGASAYFYASAIMLNPLIFHKPEDVYGALVVKKYVSRGGYRTGRHYSLEIGPWELQNELDNYEVTPEFHHTVRESQSICFYVYNGFLGVVWYRLDHCTGAPKESPSSMDSVWLR